VAVLTEIYLCTVCSCQEILRRHGHGQFLYIDAAREVASLRQAPGTPRWHGRAPASFQVRQRQIASMIESPCMGSCVHSGSMGGLVFQRTGSRLEVALNCTGVTAVSTLGVRVLTGSSNLAAGRSLDPIEHNDDGEEEGEGVLVVYWAANHTLRVDHRKANLRKPSVLVQNAPVPRDIAVADGRLSLRVFVDGVSQFQSALVPVEFERTEL
jgi:hypothetical protein